MINRFTQIIMIVLIAVSTLVYNDIHAATITSDFKVPKNFKFTKNLYLGQTLNPDISYLQNILNMDISTQVATGTVAGSNLNLTNYYGEKTKSAVLKFQSLFENDIQYEFKLANPISKNIFKTSSSFIDMYTIGVLNKLILIYDAERKGLNYTNNSTSTIDAVNKINNINNSSDDVEVIRFDIQQEQTRATDPSPTGVTKNIFAHSPEGQLAQLIGGYALVDKVYNYTPSGFINNTVTGTTNGQGLGGGVTAIAGAAAVGVGATALGGAGGSAVGGATKTILQPFGGISVSMVTCACSANLLLYVKDPRGFVLPLIYQPGATMLYKMYNPTVAVNLLGQYTLGGQCLIYVGTGCSSGGTPVGTMVQVGTSLTI